MVRVSICINTMFVFVWQKSDIKPQLSNVTWEFGVGNPYYNKVKKYLSLYVIEICGWDLKTTF